MTTLLRQGLKRYVPEDRLARLGELRLGIAGLGGIGSNVAFMLARTGLSRFVLVDEDTVEPSNLNRQLLATWDQLGKPKVEVYEAFCEKYKKLNQKFGKEQYLVPYLMSSHPGSTLNDAITLALSLKKNKIVPEQVQDFYPTPGTLSTAMYYTGIDPRTMKPVYVEKTAEGKAMQRALLQARNPKNRGLVVKALKKAKREDLIGRGGLL